MGYIYCERVSLKRSLCFFYFWKRNMDKQAEKNLFAELRVGNEKAYKLFFKYEFESFLLVT